VPALADALVFRCRMLNSNLIRTIANGAFTGLTALRYLYGAGLWVRVIFGACCLVFAWMLGLFSPGLIEACFLLTMACSSGVCLSNKLLCFSAHDCMPSTHRFNLS
jgi:hypothetical protein